MGPFPKGVFLTKGVGKHREKLNSFELALRSAGIAEYNLVRVQSIFPAYCKLISPPEGLKHLTPGQIVFAVVSDNATDEPHRLMASSVGVAIPANPSQYGYLSEHHSFGETDQKAGDYAEDLAAMMLATILGVDFRSQCQLRRAQGRMARLGQDRHHAQRYAVGDRRPRRIVDLGSGGGGVRRST
jgi:arginine decarboxylase